MGKRVFFKSKRNSKTDDANLAQKVMQTIDRTQAVIFFKPDGTIINANENFLSAMGYDLSEIKGKHHSIFVDPEIVKSQDYKDFWASLAAGDYRASQFPRLRKDGSTIWIGATYAAVFGEDGSVECVVKTAVDVSERRAAICEISNALSELRKGNLAYNLKKFDIEDMDEICTAFNQASEQLSDAMWTITEVSTEVNQTITTVNKSSDELSARTGRQAATLEEVAATLEVLTNEVKTLSGNALGAESMASDTRASATSSEKVVGESIQAMADIQKSSNEISKIISVIDDIAFQTNLLALNAGVEAARAKEAGSGFAVVATEVRSLAQRSQEAAAEIKTLISQSSDQVTQGVEMVNGAADELKQIIAGVTEIADKISVIAGSASEQSETLIQINSSVGDLDTATQKNARMVEEVTNTNRALSNSLERMTRQLDIFETDGNRSEAPSPRRMAG